jgi:DNA-binding MarR family transcriptional regulator
MRRPTAFFGLTVARFDLMFELFGSTDSGRDRYASVRQSGLRRSLGVTAPVVSRMLRSLEELGWIVRTRPQTGDRRQRHVFFTTAGMERMRAACKVLLKGAKRVVHEVISLGMHLDPGMCFEHMGNLESYLLYMGRSCGDTATLWYPWHPDD